MKNVKGSRTGRFINSIFKLKEWSNFTEVKGTFSAIKQAILRLFIPQKAKHPESLKAAMMRLSLTEEDIEFKKRGLFRNALMMIFLALLVFVYCMYHLLHAHYEAVAVSAVVTLVALAMAFRYHFWHFQIKKRKLGCTLKEWFYEGLLGEQK